MFLFFETLVCFFLVVFLQLLAKRQVEFNSENSLLSVKVGRKSAAVVQVLPVSLELAVSKNKTKKKPDWLIL